ncbi:MAG: HNH endonuclease [Spirochaetia bacterium]|nr:HNH endonuclease [Spirochaetia bacterium]
MIIISVAGGTHSMIDRQAVYSKFGGRCAYTGKPLESDWQVDHIVPKEQGGTDDIDNLFPALKIVNHYKRCLDNETFKTWLLGGLHLRLRKLPKNPRTERGMKRKAYLLKVADVFGITEDKPFCGKFFFEK